METAGRSWEETVRRPEATRLSDGMASTSGIHTCPPCKVDTTVTRYLESLLDTNNSITIDERCMSIDIFFANLVSLTQKPLRNVQVVIPMFNRIIEAHSASVI